MGDILRHSHGDDVRHRVDARLFAHMPIIRDIVYGAAANGADLNDICKKLRIDIADLDDSDKRAGFETSCLAWELAVKMTGDPLLGLHLGESTNPAIMGLVGYLMQNSKTLLDAFRQVNNYGRIATNMFAYDIIERKNEIILEYTPIAIWRQLYPNGSRQAVDQAMAGTLNVFYLLGGKRVDPASVELAGMRRGDRNEYERVFRSPVRISKNNQLVFDRERLLAPVLRCDRSLFRVFEGIVTKKGRKSTFAGQIRDLIIGDFKGIVPPIDVLASKLHITPRTLQRRLSTEKTSFRRISGQITKEMGRKLLQTTDYKMADIARFLGYSSPRSFRRAYNTSRKA